MSIPYPSFHHVAQTAGVEYCAGVTPDGQPCGEPRTSAARHKAGFAEGETVHFTDRRVTRSSIRQFALLAARLVTGPEVDTYPAWKRTWLLSSNAEEICRKRLHVRIPSAYWNLDRWTVRAQLAQVPTSAPQRGEALYWASMAP